MSKFTDFGYTQAQIDEKFQQVLDTIFTNEETKFYYDNGDGTAYFTDTGNDDVRTEGMSYGMMIALQLDDQVMFNKFWAWVNKYMLITDGPMHGFFKWSAQRSGVSNAEGSTPDGEEFFAAALLMAANRWGDGEGIFNYTAEAKSLLHEMVHKDEEEGGRGMFDPETTYIRFVAEMDISDPSYHLPHFYEVYAQYGNEEDRVFFERAADASREYLKKAMNPETGMSAEYANYDGTPNDFRGHGSFFSDA
ncbi:glycosyl hydrolase family 8 [Weissella confusa]|uniref:glycosyl hydrolase family 8 n=1 Tax=Weissella confusa TaxID=1583 RepID=UPI000AC818D4|nr:glycosyl hydrolase family 8 [Weissella confusa]